MLDNKNLRAFLDTIAQSEGTADQGDRGYNVIVGSTAARPSLFASYADHPRVRVKLRPDLTSTAAGRYQVLARYFDAYRVSLSLPDFGPESQDRIAVQMIREQKALDDVLAGRFNAAAAKVSNIWASFPGAGYGQRENTLAALRSTYVERGGAVA